MFAAIRSASSRVASSQPRGRVLSNRYSFNLSAKTASFGNYSGGFMKKVRRKTWKFPKGGRGQRSVMFDTSNGEKRENLGGPISGPSSIAPAQQRI